MGKLIKTQKIFLKPLLSMAFGYCMALRFSLATFRPIGLAKTHLQHVFSAVAMNISRLVSWPLLSLFLKFEHHDLQL